MNSRLTASVLMFGGPISGPLFLRAVKHWRARDKWLAALYGVAIVEVWIILPVVLSWMVHKV